MKYRYDIRIGHYIPEYTINSLLEADMGTPEGEVSLELQDTLVLTKSVILTNLETEDIVQMKKDMNTKLLAIQKEIQTKSDNINLILANIAQLQSENKDQEKTTEAQKKLLQAKLDLVNKQFDYDKTKTDELKKILAALTKLLESYISPAKVESVLPDKYKYLFNEDKSINESNVQNAKVYVDKLIKDDGMERIKGMVDFKKAFKDSDLLYGRDKDGGYFAVCVDQQDFNKLVDTLEEAGFYKEDILAQCLSQIFDRSNLIK